MDEYTNVLNEILEQLRGLNQNLESYKQKANWRNYPTIYSMIDEINDNVRDIKSTTESIGDRRKFCVIDDPRQYENLRLSQE